MDKKPSTEPKEKTVEPPAPEVLVPRADDGSQAPEAAKAAADAKPLPSKRLHHTYHPSHKATFIGLAVVVAILAVNAGIIGFVIKSQSKDKSKASQGDVTISQSVLDKLGVNRSAVGDLGVALTVSPDARFSGNVTVDKTVSIAGELKLNSKFSATDASLAQLEAGNTSLQKLNVNGDSTVSNLNLRNDLLVTGVSRLQGPVTMSQLLTVNNNANIAGSLSVGGTLSVNSFHAGSIVLDSSLTIGGHVITRGSAPGVGPGPALGQNGTVSISGNDAAGTVAVNIGAGGGGGTLVSIAFRNQYGTIPHVVITPIGASASNFYVNRSVGGFSIAVSGSIPAGSYAFDYIVEQ
ncbi:MAG TPA: hypothetical protein VLG13_01940 [Patescibacteria group bacterium]|nr:hypothetical protein [Patescibacteria group bacterium]